jgi:hypothetical protein
MMNYGPVGAGSIVAECGIIGKKANKERCTDGNVRKLSDPGRESHKMKVLRNKD